jgi:hypothetical protein
VTNRTEPQVREAMRMTAGNGAATSTTMKGYPAMRLLICGTVVSNGGDRAILESELDVLRLDGTAVAVTDNLPVVATRLFPDLDVGPWVFDTVRTPTFGPRRVRAIPCPGVARRPPDPRRRRGGRHRYEVAQQ